MKEKDGKIETRGRKPKINDIDFNDVENYGKLGLTDKEISKRLGIAESTLNNYKKQYPLFMESLKKGKSIADEKVVESLYRRACGYTHPEIEITSYQGNVTITPILKHYPPDPVSMIFWLKNRQPTKWREKTEVQMEIDIPQNVDELSDKEIDELFKKLQKKD